MTRYGIVSVEGTLVGARVSKRNFNQGVFGNPINYGRDMRRFSRKMEKAAKQNAPKGDRRNYQSKAHKVSRPGKLKRSIKRYESKSLSAAINSGTASRALVGVRARTPYALYVEEGTEMVGVYSYSWAKDRFFPGKVKRRSSSGQRAQRFMLRAWLQSGGVGSATRRAYNSSFGGGRP